MIFLHNKFILAYKVCHMKYWKIELEIKCDERSINQIGLGRVAVEKGA